MDHKKGVRHINMLFRSWMYSSGVLVTAQLSGSSKHISDPLSRYGQSIKPSKGYQYKYKVVVQSKWRMRQAEASAGQAVPGSARPREHMTTESPFAACWFSRSGAACWISACCLLVQALHAESPAATACGVQQVQVQHVPGSIKFSSGDFELSEWSVESCGGANWGKHIVLTLEP